MVTECLWFRNRLRIDEHTDFETTAVRHRGDVGASSGDGAHGDDSFNPSTSAEELHGSASQVGRCEVDACSLRPSGPSHDRGWQHVCDSGQAADTTGAFGLIAGVLCRLVHESQPLDDRNRPTWQTDGDRCERVTTCLAVDASAKHKT